MNPYNNVCVNVSQFKYYLMSLLFKKEQFVEGNYCVTFNCFLSVHT